jgi:RNA polymerase sigma factor (sigma-70 family)
MRHELATDQQLLTIIKEDKDCPAHLLSGVVKEALARGLFKKLVYWVFDNLIKNWRRATTAWNMENQDLLSIGYCGVLSALERWNPGKSSFKTFAYMNIRSEFTHMLDGENAEKRYIYKITDSYDKETDEGVPFKDFIPVRENVEREALRNITFQSKMKLLSSREKDVILYFIKGYSLSDIAYEIYQFKSMTMVHRNFHRALEKLGLHDFKLKERKVV